MNAQSAVLDGVMSPLRLSAFEHARKHSRKVRALKRVLPAAAMFLVVLFVFVAWRSSAAAVRIEADSSAITDGRLVMANPKMEGFSKEGRPYTVIATRAIQAMETESDIQLDRIDATLPVNDKGWMSVSAPGGVYDRKANTLTLDGGETGGIKVVSSDNTTIFMHTAVIDMDSGVLRAKNNIDIKRDDGALSAKSAKVSKDGKVLVFEKKVRLTVDPSRSSKKEDGNAKP